VKLFLMINCGGIIDLTQTAIIARTEAEIFLFDIHKPIHHMNVQSPRVKVVDDGYS
jgi:cell division control protein 45